jgi:hypothetical protein
MTLRLGLVVMKTNVTTQEEQGTRSVEKDLKVYSTINRSHTTPTIIFFVIFETTPPHFCTLFPSSGTLN